MVAILFSGQWEAKDLIIENLKRNLFDSSLKKAK